jgi:hypothetical protein
MDPVASPSRVKNTRRINKLIAMLNSILLFGMYERMLKRNRKNIFEIENRGTETLL